MNPIHGADLATVCVGAIVLPALEVQAGGPEILSQNKIAEIVFKTLNKEVKITYLPDWIRRLILLVVRTFTNSKLYGPVEFALTAIAINMVAPEYGHHTLSDYFKQNV